MLASILRKLLKFMLTIPAKTRVDLTGLKHPHIGWEGQTRILKKKIILCEWIRQRLTPFYFLFFILVHVCSWVYVCTYVCLVMVLERVERWFPVAFLPVETLSPALLSFTFRPSSSLIQGCGVRLYRRKFGRPPHTLCIHGGPCVGGMVGSWRAETHAPISTLIASKVWRAPISYLCNWAFTERIPVIIFHVAKSFHHIWACP